MVSRQVDLDSSVVHLHEEGAGRPLVFLHGFPLDHTMWRGQLSELANGYRVLAPDLPGFGKSGFIGASEYVMEEFADDLADLLDRTGVSDPIVLCGLSMGGYIAWQFWRRHRERLASLILCDTRAVPDSEAVARGRRYMAERVLEHGSTSVAEEMISKLFSPGTLETNAQIVGETRDVMQSTRRETIAAAQRGMAKRPDMTPHLGEMQLPALLLAGEHDEISTPSEMNSIAGQMPNAEFVAIPDAGHMAPLECPKRVNEVIQRFLKNA